MTKMINNTIAEIKRAFGLRDTVEMQRQYGVVLPLNRLTTPLRVMLDTDYSEDESYL